MSKFDEFEQCNGPRLGCQALSPAGREIASDHLPFCMRDFWDETGLCGYHKGAFWFCDPADYHSYVSNNSDLAGFTVIGRNAFGDLFVWKESLYFYAPHVRQKGEITPHLEVYFNMAFCTKDTRKHMWRLPEFRSVLARLGPIEVDECYGYDPIPALGGSGKPDTFKRVKILPYLEIVRQAVEA